MKKIIIMALIAASLSVTGCSKKPEQVANNTTYEILDNGSVVNTTETVTVEKE